MRQIGAVIMSLCSGVACGVSCVPLDKESSGATKGGMRCLSLPQNPFGPPLILKQITVVSFSRHNLGSPLHQESPRSP